MVLFHAGKFKRGVFDPIEVYLIEVGVASGFNWDPRLDGGRCPPLAHKSGRFTQKISFNEIVEDENALNAILERYEQTKPEVNDTI